MIKEFSLHSLQQMHDRFKGRKEVLDLVRHGQLEDYRYIKTYVQNDETRKLYEIQHNVYIVLNMDDRLITIFERYKNV